MGIYDLPTDQFNTTIKVTPRVLYTFQVIAKEDKGSGLFGGGIDYNKSPTTQFQTSRHNENVKPDINVLPPPKKKLRDENEPTTNTEDVSSNNIRDMDQNPHPQSDPDPDTFLSVEMIG